MSTNTPPTSAKAKPGKPGKPERVYVKIPTAGPGQGYSAPKNYAQPLLSELGRLAIILACLALPIIPALIIVMIVLNTHASEPYLLWLWITMTLIVEPFAIFVAFGLAREAIGVQRASDFLEPLRGLLRAQ